MRGQAVRLERVPLDGCELDPYDALALLRGRSRPFALVGEWAGGGAVLGCDPLRVASAPGADPFGVLDEQPSVAGAGAGGGGPEAAAGGGGLRTAAGDAGAGAFGGGWVGYLGYSLGARVERLPPPPPRPRPLPPFALAFYDHVLRLDGDGRWWFEALISRDEQRAARVEARLEDLRRALAEARPAPPRPYRLGAFDVRGGRGHAAAVEWCRRYIAAGDLYQANLCLRLEADFDGDALDLFAHAGRSLRSGYAAYLGGPWGAIASFSPELFLRRRGRTVVTRPIKGTSLDRDALARSEKDRAENVMIVDLMRNDLGKSCAPGSIRVTELAEPRRGPGVWHLVSEVTGSLAGDAGDGDLVRGCFPPGSVTGAPKIKAMEVIAQLESTGREAYTGAIGYASPLAGLELNVAIRTFEVAGGAAWLGAGGGITWGSDPRAEYRECMTKAAPLVAAAGSRVAGGGEEGAPRAAELPPPSRAPRPDPALGVFETLLALDRRVVALGPHLERLRASARTLYGMPLPDGLAEAVERAAARADGPRRLRVTLKPGISEPEVESLPAAPFPAEPLELRPLTLPGGLGAHKWADRALVSAPPEPLILDLDGELLETGSGNVFLVEGDALVTPPADGRILPGVTRRELLRLAAETGRRTVVEPIDAERARAADALLVTSAIRGVQAVARAEGIGAWSGTAAAAELAGLLRDAWRAERRPAGSS
jgi:para-aminobenzoate synthetase/4-amino-4-deoxychorismate lyase